MKRFFFLAALLFGLAACQTEPEGLDVNVGGEQLVTVNVTVPEAETRAVELGSNKGVFNTTILDDDNTTMRYILQVYLKTTNEASEEVYVQSAERLVEYSDGKSANFEVRLVPGRDYQFVAWADVVVNGEKDIDNHYVTMDDNKKSTLGDIKFKGEWNAMDESRDAFTATIPVDDYSGTSTIDLKLTRPFAKLRVVTTDIENLTNLGITPTTAKATYVSKHYESFNAVDATFDGEVSNVEHEYDIVMTDGKNIYGEGNKAKEFTIFTDYFFANDETVKFTLDVNDSEGTPIKSNSFVTDINVKRNYLTTIKGNILTDGKGFTVTIDDAFANKDNPEDHPYYLGVYTGAYTETIKLKTGNYIFNDASVNTTTGPAIEIEEDAEVTIYVQGNLDLVGATHGIYVPATSTLTIEGVASTRATAEKFGNINVVAKEGSAIGGSNITIQNLAGLTAKANGNHAFGIGGADATVVIKNTKIDYVAGGHIQPLWVNDTKYGKLEPEGGAAIGGTNVTIENSEIVKAEGGSKAAAIGNRFHCNTNITIKNSTLGDIFGGNASAAIGGSRYSSNITADNKQTTKIKIENSTITNAVGGQAGAGIGSGYDTHCTANNSNAVNEIVITNSTIKAQGGKYAAGIGTGFHAAALTGSIDAASTIDATRGEDFYKGEYTTAQNIGYGVVDPAREFKGAVVTFTVAGETIAHPLYAGYEKKNDGAYFDEANNKYYITNAAGLKWVADVVNATTPYTATIFDEAVVELTNDIDLNNEEWIPIGDDRSQRTEWHGVFDGMGYTVKNIKITKKTDRDDENKSSYGLFGNVKGTVKNLTVENVSISGAPKFIGALIGRLNDGLVENCHVKSSSVECNNWTIGGLVGQLNNGKISGCSVEGTTIKGYAAVGAIAGIALNSGERTIENCSVKNCSIVKNGSFGGDFDKMFGAVLGAVYNGSLTVYINGCSVESTTVLGEVSSTIFGHATEGDQVFVDGECFTPTSVATSDALTDALAKGESVVMTDDIETEAATPAPYGNKYAFKLDGGTLDGNGHELNMEFYGDDYGIMTSGGTIKNLTIEKGCRAVMIMYPTQDVILDNVKIGGDGVLYPINTGEAGADDVNLVVTNSTLAGWTSYGNIKSASFTNVQFKQGTYYNNIYGRVLKPYVNTTLTDCSFIEHMNLDLSSLTNGHKVTFKNCTVNGQVITASTFTVPSTDAEYDTELFTIDLPSWASSVNDCVIFE